MAKHDDIEIISLKTFLHIFSADRNDAKRFCFILGAGASKQSGIKTGGELVDEWLEEIKEKYTDDEITAWKKEKGITDENKYEHYPDVYEYRYKGDEQSGFARIEKEMEHAEPSCGYSVLAQVMAETNHNLVITTNFDSLTEDAMFIYTKKKPLVIGHESLAGFIRPFSTRPMIAKIHRDLLLSPKNHNDGVSELEENWEKALNDVFGFYTPIVIGYGGNDGSLMGFMDKMPHIHGGIFWCYRGELPGEKITNLLRKHNGKLVQIEGFDELMFNIAQKSGYNLMDTQIEEVSKTRATRYREQIEAIKKKQLSQETKEAIENIVKSSPDSWWKAYLEIMKEPDIGKRDKLFEEVIKIYNYHELIGNYALFLHEQKKDYDKAEEYYKKALEIVPSDADYLGNYANFLWGIRENYDKAEEFYKKALEIDPNHANNLGNYALFLGNIRKDYDKAEEYYKKTFKIDPNSTVKLIMYALFLSDIRKDYDKAEEYYKKALEIVPNDADYLGNYAKLLIDTGRYNEAKTYIDKSFTLNNNEKNDLTLELWFYMYAVYLEYYTEGERQVEELLAKGIRSPGWVLDGVVAAARNLNHPNIAKVEEFARRIAEEG